MRTAKQLVMDVLDDMPDNQILQVLSYAKFVKSEQEPELYLSEEEDDEIAHILETDEWIDADIVFR